MLLSLVVPLAVFASGGGETREVHVAGNRDYYVLMMKAANGFGLHVEKGFNREYRKYLENAKGQILLIETHNGKPVVHENTLDNIFPSASEGIDAENGSIEIDGTLIVFIDFGVYSNPLSKSKKKKAEEIATEQLALVLNMENPTAALAAIEEFDWDRGMKVLKDETNDQEGMPTMDISEIRYKLTDGKIYLMVETKKDPVFEQGILDLDVEITTASGETTVLDINVRSDGSYDYWADQNDDGKLDYSAEKMDVPGGGVSWDKEVKSILPVPEGIDAQKISITKVAMHVEFWSDTFYQR